VIVDDFIAYDGDAWRALLGHVLSQDILHKVILPSRPVDDPLPVLNARKFGGSDRVVIQIDDPLIAANHGVWSIGADGATRCDERPLLNLSVETITELAFGAQPATALAAVGRVQANQATIEALSLMFATDLKPHSGISF
jgi:predicted acetyltransferase